MEKRIIAGVEINKISMKNLFFNKEMFLAYILLAFAIVGLYEIFGERYFLLTANSFDAGLNPGSREVAEAMREAIFGAGGEVKREAPWSLYIVNYMYMIYTGSGIIFLVSVGELFNITTIKKTAAGYMSLGLAMIFGGLFTISADLNILHIGSMFSSPKFTSGMWLMLPLYAIYIPLIIFEIYLLVTHKENMAKKMALPVLIFSLLVEIVEYYVQAKLFNMNVARHLWTTYPFLTLYFIISALATSAATMILYAFFVYKKSLKDNFPILINFLKDIALFSIVILGAYEATAYLFIDPTWGLMILFGNFKFYFYTYIAIAIGIPFVLIFRAQTSNTAKFIASIFIVVGAYIGRLIFVYGGNAYPMSDRFGIGFEKYGEYEVVKDIIFFMPSWGEIFIVIGSFGVILMIYKLLNSLFSVSKILKH